jgi:hypothetical protein
VTRVSQTIDRIDATFDDPNLVANAGLVLVATLTQRLGLEALINATVRLVGRVGGARPGRKVLTLVHAIIAGASHIDHVDMLRAGSTEKVLGHRVMAPRRSGRSCGRSRSVTSANSKPSSAGHSSGPGRSARDPTISRW